MDMKIWKTVAVASLSAASLVACSGPEEVPDEPIAATAAAEEEEGPELARAPERDEGHWTYSGETGPKNWGERSPEWAQCAQGQMQSPIDFAEVEDVELAPLQIATPNAATQFVNKGHALQVVFPKGNTLKTTDASYQLQQMHFHTPAEHTVEGQTYPLEGHMVFADGSGNLAVVGVLFEEGARNPALQPLIDAVPTSVGVTSDLSAEPFLPTELLPESPEYYRYTGSLTTPPCTEGVTFHIMTEPIQASAEQIRLLYDAVGEPNARPVQPLNDRPVTR